MPVEHGSRWALIAGVAVALSVALRVLASWIEARSRSRALEALRASGGPVAERASAAAQRRENRR